MISLAGTHTALVTPFRDDDARSIDLEAFDALVEAQIEGGIAGVVPCGTTGESPTLDHVEWQTVVSRAVTVARKRTRVIAGTGSSSTAHAIEMSRKAEAAGADAVMVVVPYYNKPTQAGLVEHYKLVSRAVSCPVIVYNIPGRAGIDLAAETLARIAEACPNVVATKEATGNVLRAQEIACLLGDRMMVLSGDDGLTVPMMSIGARGVISVTSNLYPREVATVTSLMDAGKLTEARRAHLALLPVHAAMFVESNPAPVKYALSWKGRMRHGVRPPLAPLSEEGKKKVVAACEAFEKGR